MASLLGRGWVEEPDFSLYRRAIPVLDPRGPVFRSNPHNPSGVLAAPDEIAGVWDEAFYQLATGSWTRGDSEAPSRSIVVGSLTKLLACPGLRAGYVICPDESDSRRGVVTQADVGAQRDRRGLPPRDARAGRSVVVGGVDSGVAQGVDRLARVVTACLFALLTPTGCWWTASRIFAPCSHRWASSCATARASGFAGCSGSRSPMRTVSNASGSALRAAFASPGRINGSERARSAGRGRPSDASSGPRETLRGALLVCGTGSDVGKSAVVTGLCRLLARRGISVAPFKAQNMALNSWVTDDGAEIGRAQGVQAVAAGVPAEAAMNPILLKPTGDRHSQVVVLGEPWANMDAAGYHEAKAELVPVVHDALADLRSRFDVVVCEGAGSPAEINLLDHDIVNLSLAARAGMPAVDRGRHRQGRRARRTLRDGGSAPDRAAPDGPWLRREQVQGGSCPARARARRARDANRLTHPRGAAVDLRVWGSTPRTRWLSIRPTIYSCTAEPPLMEVMSSTSLWSASRASRTSPTSTRSGWNRPSVCGWSIIPVRSGIPTSSCSPVRRPPWRTSSGCAGRDSPTPSARSRGSPAARSSSGSAVATRCSGSPSRTQKVSRRGARTPQASAGCRSEPSSAPKGGGAP